MSGDSEIPPTYYFSGITFNPSFYQSSSSDYLTLATAKSSFLSYPTAQGSETIATLNSSSIDTTTLTSSGLITANGGINVPTGQSLTVVGTQTSTGLITANGGVSTTTLIASGLITADGGIQLPVGDSLNVLGNISGSGNITTSGEISTSGSGAISTAGGGSIKTNAYESRTTTSNMTIGATMTNAANILIGTNCLIQLKSPAITNTGSTPSTQAATNTTLYGGLMYASVTSAYTIPSNINREFFLVITGGTKTITMPALNIHLIINIRVLSASSMNITAPVVGTMFYPNGGADIATTYSMPAGSAQRFYCDGSSWLGF